MCAIASTRKSFFGAEGMRASIANTECGVRERCSRFLGRSWEAIAKKMAAREGIPVRPFKSTVSLYCLLGLLGSDFGSGFVSGLLAAGGLDVP